MGVLLRRLRGLLGIGLTWGTMWAAVGAVLGIVVGILAPQSIDPGEGPLNIAWILGTAGFFSGVTFALVLSRLERGRSLRSISLPRGALWGAIGAAVIPLLTPVADAMLIFTCPLGALLAAGSITIARRQLGSKEQVLLKPGED